MTDQSRPRLPAVSEAARYRLSVLARVLAAFLGAYGLTALFTMLTSQILIRARTGQAEAVLASTIPAFVVYAAIFCAIFHARSARRAWAWLAGTALPLAALVWIMEGPAA